MRTNTTVNVSPLIGKGDKGKKPTTSKFLADVTESLLWRVILRKPRIADVLMTSIKIIVLLARNS